MHNHSAHAIHHMSESFGEIGIAIFLMALAGGFAHCAFMCGPFVLMQNSEKRENQSMLGKLKNALLIPYHLGRMTTYTLLGVLVSFLGSASQAMWQHAGTVLLLLAASLLILSTIPKGKSYLLSLAPKAVTNTLAKVSKPYSASQSFMGRYMLGVTLGFIPCGMVYAALATAAASANPLNGGLLMLIFAAGTIPALITVSFLGNFLLKGGRKIIQNISVYVTFIVGFWLYYLALKPFLF